MEVSEKRYIEHVLNDAIVSNNACGKIETKSGATYFIKSGKYSRAYQCEANGLNELIKADCIRVARPIIATDTFIVTEYISQEAPNKNFFVRLGKEVARLHLVHGKYYGFYENNYIGSTVQKNISVGYEREDWCTFYLNKRLLYQLELALRNGANSKVLESGVDFFTKHLKEILGENEELPSLLHGDLWGGNYLCDEYNNPVLIDPAVYFGDREADIAMTLLFGGFPEDFYKGYEQVYPLRKGWRNRIGVYQLYHILNHFNMFGGGYLYESERLIKLYI